MWGQLFLDSSDVGGLDGVTAPTADGCEETGKGRIGVQDRAARVEEHRADHCDSFILDNSAHTRSASRPRSSSVPLFSTTMSALAMSSAGSLCDAMRAPMSASDMPRSRSR